MQITHLIAQPQTHDTVGDAFSAGFGEWLHDNRQQERQHRCPAMDNIVVVDSVCCSLLLFFRCCCSLVEHCKWSINMGASTKEVAGSDWSGLVVGPVKA